MRLPNGTPAAPASGTKRAAGSHRARWRAQGECVGVMEGAYIMHDEYGPYKPLMVPPTAPEMAIQAVSLYGAVKRQAPRGPRVRHGPGRGCSDRGSFGRRLWRAGA